MGRLLYLCPGHSGRRDVAGEGGKPSSSSLGRFGRPSPTVPAGGGPAPRHTGTLPAALGAAGSRGGGSGRRGGAALTSWRGRAPPFPQPLRLLASGPRRLPEPSRARGSPPTHSPRPYRPGAPPLPPHRPRGRPLPPFSSPLPSLPPLPRADAVRAAPALTWRPGAEQRGATRAASGVSAGAAAAMWPGRGARAAAPGLGWRAAGARGTEVAAPRGLVTGRAEPRLLPGPPRGPCGAGRGAAAAVGV